MLETIEMSTISIPECPCCHEEFNPSDGCIPLVLICGHSVCESCVGHLYRIAIGVMKCPVCRRKIPHIQEKIPKNFVAIEFFGGEAVERPEQGMIKMLEKARKWELVTDIVLIFLYIVAYFIEMYFLFKFLLI